MEKLYLSTDKFTLITLIIISILYFYTCVTWWKHIKGKETENFKRTQKVFFFNMIIGTIGVYGALIVYLILIFFGDKPLNNLSLIYTYLAFVIIPTVYFITVRAYIKWSTSGIELEEEYSDDELESIVFETAKHLVEEYGEEIPEEKLQEVANASGLPFELLNREYKFFVNIKNLKKKLFN